METSYGLISTSRQLHTLGQIISLLWCFISSSENNWLDSRVSSSSKIYSWWWWCCCYVMSDSFVTPWTILARFLCPLDFLDKNTGVGSHFPSLGHLPNPEIKPVSPASAGYSLLLTHQGSP